MENRLGTTMTRRREEIVARGARATLNFLPLNIKVKCEKTVANNHIPIRVSAYFKCWPRILQRRVRKSTRIHNTRGRLEKSRVRIP